jgi:hypothetical protein
MTVSYTQNLLLNMFICHYLTSNCNCGAWLSNSQLGQSWLMTQIGIAREGSYDFGMFGKRPKLNKYAKRRQTICGLADEVVREEEL